MAGLEENDHGEIQKAYLTLLAAFMFVTWVDRVRIDPVRDRVTRQRGFLVPIPWESYKLSDYERVELRKKLKRDGEGDGTYLYHIILAGKEPDTLARIKSAYPARRAAERIAQGMVVPLDNRAFGRRTVRSPKVLDTPVAERWARTAKKFELPELPSDSGVRMAESGNRLTVRFPARSRHLRGLLLMLLVFLAGFALTVTTMGLNPFSLLSALGVLSLLHLGMKLIGNSKLVFAQDRISFRSGIALFKDRMKLCDIEEVIVTDALTLISDRRGLRITLPEKKEDAAFIKQLIRREILQRSAGTEGRKFA